MLRVSGHDTNATQLTIANELTPEPYAELEKEGQDDVAVQTLPVTYSCLQMREGQSAQCDARPEAYLMEKTLHQKRTHVLCNDEDLSVAT